MAISTPQPRQLPSGNSLGDDTYLKLLEGIAYRPVFVMGQHRSGTTLLYELLGLTGVFNVLTAYHIMRFDELLANHEENLTVNARDELQRQFDSLNLTTRGIDNVAVTVDSLEEYCFILQPRIGRVSLSRRSLPTFDLMCRKLQYLQQAARPLLLKNPFDFLNFLYIKSAFPSARFLFIHRDPMATLDSQLKAQRTHWTRGNPYLTLLSPRLARLQAQPLLRALVGWATNPDSRVHLSRRVLAWHMKKTLNRYLEEIIHLSDEDYRVVRYEDLCRQPEIEMAKMLQFLNLDGQQAHIDFRSRIQPRSIPISPALQQYEQPLRSLHAKILSYHGYSVES